MKKILCALLILVMTLGCYAYAVPEVLLNSNPLPGIFEKVSPSVAVLMVVSNVWDAKTDAVTKEDISSGSAVLVKEAVEPIVGALALAVQEVVQDAPEELSADLLRTGLILTGGGALLSGLDKVLAERTGLTCHIPETPSLCTGKGMARIIQDPLLSELAIRKG